MKQTALILGLILIVACSKRMQQSADTAANETKETSDTLLMVSELMEYRKQLNIEFRDSAASPLKEADRKNFEELEFFPINLTYRVKAKFTRTPGERPFKMKTTTERLPEYVKFGVAEFVLLGDSYKLNIYQNLALAQKQAYKNYLFLPFTDLTNGFETYGGGRYLDLRIAEGDSIILDFNKAYNPYCAYNDRYSCPLPPSENHLSIRIKAGVKAFGAQ